MRILCSSVAVVCILTAVNSSVHAERVKVGDKVKNFTLKDQNNKDVSLKDLLKTSKVAIVFHRSANW